MGSIPKPQLTFAFVRAQVACTPHFRFVPWGRAFLIRSMLWSPYQAQSAHMSRSLVYLLLFLHTPPKENGAFRWIKLFCLTLQAEFLHSLGWQRFISLSAPRRKRRLRGIINHANCLLQQCQESDHSHTNYQYSWHLSKNSGHAYPSAFREVSMCKHPFTIFRVMLKLFITCLSVHRICCITLTYWCLLLVIPLLHCVFRALGCRMFLKLSNM